MKKIFCIALLLAVVSCDRKSEDVLPATVMEFDKFTLEASSKWKQFSAQGYDSKVGGITNGRDTLRYDYGWHSYRFTNETDKTQNRVNAKIDGKDALIVQPKDKGKGLIGVYIQVDDMMRFNLYGVSKDEEEVVAIFNSVKFK